MKMLTANNAIAELYYNVCIFNFENVLICFYVSKYMMYQTIVSGKQMFSGSIIYHRNFSGGINLWVLAQTYTSIFFYLLFGLEQFIALKIENV